MSSVIQLSTVSAAERDQRDQPAGAQDVVAASVRSDAVYVVHTTPDDTLAAIEVAKDFAKAFGVSTTVVHFRTVPYVLPVEAPTGISPLETNAFIERLRQEDLNVRVRVYLCRNERRTMPFAFRKRSLIVIAGRPSWWPTRSERLRRTLETAGHLVVFVDKENSHA
jgi:hypothetical protein